MHLQCADGFRHKRLVQLLFHLLDLQALQMRPPVWLPWLLAQLVWMAAQRPRWTLHRAHRMVLSSCYSEATGHHDGSRAEGVCDDQLHAARTLLWLQEPPLPQMNEPLPISAEEGFPTRRPCTLEDAMQQKVRHVWRSYSGEVVYAKLEPIPTLPKRRRHVAAPKVQDRKN